MPTETYQGFPADVIRAYALAVMGKPLCVEQCVAYSGRLIQHALQRLLL